MAANNHSFEGRARDPRLRDRTRLDVLREEARLERETIVEERLLAGGDPWSFMQELPTVDELVVYLLRADAISANDGRRPSPTREYRVLRQIALEYPELTTTVWFLLGDHGPLEREYW